LQLIRDSEMSGDPALSAAADESGAFSFHGVLPGRYRLEASATVEEKVLSARLAVDVGNADVAVEVSLAPAGVFEMRLHDPNGAEVSPERVQLGLRSTAASNPETFWAQQDQISSVPPGSYRVITRTSTTDISCVDSVLFGDRNVLRGIVTVKPGMNAALDVTVSRNCGEITARTGAGAKVLLLLSGSPKNPEDVLADYAGPEGELRFSGLGAGRYRMWAWQVDAFGSFVGPGALDEAQSIVAEVKTGEHVTIDVPLLKQEGGLK
jgi:hypothetical protein